MKLLVFFAFQYALVSVTLKVRPINVVLLKANPGVSAHKDRAEKKTPVFETAYIA